MNESPIFIKIYDFMVWLLPLLTTFPKDQRFRLAKRIEDSLFGFYEGIVCAAHSPEKLTFLRDADIELEKLRTYLRLAMDLRFLSFRHYEQGARLANEIGKLLGGWMKQISASPAVNRSAEGRERLNAGRILEQ